MNHIHHSSQSSCKQDVGNSVAYTGSQRDIKVLVILKDLVIDLALNGQVQAVFLIQMINMNHLNPLN
ncbi:hypothetical protein D3C71_2021780 [compost metagenome]